MKHLDLDALDIVSGGVSLNQLGLTPAPAAGQPNADPFGFGANGFGGIGPGSTNFGGVGQFGELGGVVNSIVHSPVVGGIIHSLEQANPALGSAIEGALQLISSGNVGGIPQLIGQFGAALGHPEVGQLANGIAGQIANGLGSFGINGNTTNGGALIGPGGAVPAGFQPIKSV